MRRLEDILIERNLVSIADLAEAVRVTTQTGAPVGPTLVRMGAISEDELLAASAQHFNTPILERSALPSAAAVIDAAQRLGAPLSWLIEREAVIWFDDEALCVAARRIDDAELHDALEQWTSAEKRLHIASSLTLEPLLLDLGAESQLGGDGALDPSRLMELAEEAPVIDFVNAVFTEAMAQRASDVHFEPFEDKVIVRLRIDGVLTQWRTAARGAFDAISSRVKLLSGMDIAERRMPQDGRQRIRVSGKDLDVRVSTLPTTWGESIVVRLLGGAAQIPELDELGLDADQRDILLEAIQRPNGLILVSGPTGSGKTTTVYRLINHLNDGNRKIVTIEDPVEIDAPGALQMKVRPEIGLDFAAGLRSILRQDPDIIFVGEIRDSETAKTAVRAALTGHLVISTVHTNSALAAISRLLDLEVEEFLLAEVLRVVVGQRLLRQVCETCSTPAPAASFDARLHTMAPSVLTEGAPAWRDANGCPACARSGYRGRFGVFEVTKVDSELQEAIRQRESEPDLIQHARRHGFRTLFESAMRKARAGETTFSEAFRVVSS
ncbi:general secretion pathway protein E [alpha proteobacterium U9-1i]|nr:general secretion pathway protein E [alpha proteobacterium U9-1i]